MKKLITFLGTGALLLQSTLVFAETDPNDRTTVLSGREDPELMALCRERLGLEPDEIPPNGAPLANLRRCMVDELNNQERDLRISEQQKRNSARLSQRQSRRLIKIEARTVQRSIKESILLRQQYMRGVQLSDDAMLREWLLQDRTNRRLRLKEAENTSETSGVRRSVRIACKGVLPADRKDCLQKQVETFNKLYGQ
ncbi:MAG TPA: hypothetical protein VI913_05560 [Candidatus Peribacteraceae bacterium]|nr:hypothetical protein [Candidatus Peribacteraceae bacterium]